MKKKVLNTLEKMNFNIDGLKTLRPLLKGIKVKPENIKTTKTCSSWPIIGIIDDDSILKMDTHRVGLLNKKGFYYCELQDVMEYENDMVYLSFYDNNKVNELLFSDEEVSIEPHSFTSFGITPDFEGYSFLAKLLSTEENFEEIIDKKIRKSEKKVKKLIKEKKNQK